MFKGYKTYAVAALAILGAVVQYLVGDATLAQAIQLVVTSILGITIRSAVSENHKATIDVALSTAQSAAASAQQVATQVASAIKATGPIGQRIASDKLRDVAGQNPAVDGQ
jgi:hypothetical protein